MVDLCPVFSHIFLLLQAILFNGVIIHNKEGIYFFFSQKKNENKFGIFQKKTLDPEAFSRIKGNPKTITYCD